MCKRLGFLLLTILTVPALFGARLPRVVIPEHYVLTVTPDIEAERFSGEVTIEAGVQLPTDTIELNSAEIQFRSAEVTAAGQTQKARVTVDEKAERATLKVDRPLPIGPATIRIAYDGILNRQLRGFYLGIASGKKYLASQMEATDARRAFPSFDEPDLKATFQINVIADEKHMVISNAPVESETGGPVDGKKTVRFATTPRLSTYHIALVVGDFACLSDSVDGLALRVCSQPDRVELGRFALDATKDVIRDLNRYFDIDYPFTKLDQIALTDFSAGAMENPGAVTYRETVLLVDPKTAPIGSQRRSIGTIAHELAHMWFGDLVTMRWWDDIWLNEGFASWLGSRTIERIRPQWTSATAAARDVGQPMGSDVLVATRPIRKSAETPDEIDQLFDGIAYGKTESLLRMLEAYVGEEKFRQGINLYMQRNAFDNASSGDFAGAIDDATGGAVTEILASYVSQPGVPLVRVESSRCEGSDTIVALSQSRFVLDAKRKVEQGLWSIPVCFDKGSCVVLRERTQTFRIPGCGQPLFANNEGFGYYITAYDPSVHRGFTAPKALSASERTALMRDEWLLVRAGERKLGAYLELASSFESDPELAEDVLGQLKYAARYLVADADRPLLQAFLRRQAAPHLRDLGWASRPSDTPEQRQLRTTVLGILGDEGNDTATQRRARELTNRWLRDRSAISPEVVSEVTRLAAIDGDARLYDTFLQGYRTAKTPAEKARFLTLLTAFRNPALIQRTLELTLTDEVRAQDIAGVLSGVIANPAAGEAAWKFLNDNWTALAKKIPTNHLGRVVGSMASTSCDPLWAERIRQFTTEHPLPQAGRATRMALESIGNCVALRNLQQASLSEWLRRQGAAERNTNE
ncbi:MAG TPA: M1 family metallopeptidase [Thermoanaerobaculia bacterium]|nr:M1 family metallopeptidase [Thermoanaerobaculia bacterium]